jgi:hypothetical protein
MSDVLHNFISADRALRLGQLGFSLKLFAGKFSKEGLTDPSLLSERLEYVGKSDGMLMLMSTWSLISG